MIKEENYSRDIHHCHVSNQLKMKTAESEERLEKREEKLKTQVNSLGLKHVCRKTSRSGNEVANKKSSSSR